MKMEAIIPSKRKLKEEIIQAMLADTNMDKLLIEKAKMKDATKELDKKIKEHSEDLHKKMIDIGIEKVDLGDGYVVKCVPDHVRQKLPRVDVLKKMYPQLAKELIKEIKVKGYIQVISEKNKNREYY